MEAPAAIRSRPGIAPDSAGLTAAKELAGAEFGRVRVAGYPAWLLWGMIHLSFLIGYRNRTAVLTEWLWPYVTFHRGARLITGSQP